MKEVRVTFVLAYLFIEIEKNTLLNFQSLILLFYIISQAQFKESETARGMAEEQVQKMNATNKRKREEVIEGTIKDFVANMIAKYQTELKPHADDLAQMFNGMKESEQAEPMLALLSCAASATSHNTKALEKSYQETKRLKTEMASFRSEVQSMKKPAMATPTERFVLFNPQRNRTNGTSYRRGCRSL